MSARGHLDPVACAKLWRAVLIEQLRLALAGQGASANRRVPRDVRLAQEWFASGDCVAVCWMAGVDPGWLLPRVAAQLDRPAQARAIHAVQFRAETKGRGGDHARGLRGSQVAA